MRKRKLVDEVRGEWAVSIRRACRVLMFDTSSYHYVSRRPGQAVLEKRIKEICQTRVRYGYRRVHVLLRREGWSINQKKTRRIYTTSAHHNTHLSMLLKGKGFSDRDVIPRGTAGYAAHAGRLPELCLWPECHG